MVGFHLRRMRRFPSICSHQAACSPARRLNRDGPVRCVLTGIRRFYCGAARRQSTDSPTSAWLAGAAFFAVVLVAMSGLFSAEMQEEMDRLVDVPVPTFVQLEQLFSAARAPAVPRWNTTPPRLAPTSAAIVDPSLVR